MSRLVWGFFEEDVEDEACTYAHWLYWDHPHAHTLVTVTTCKNEAVSFNFTRISVKACAFKSFPTQPGPCPWKHNRGSHSHTWKQCLERVTSLFS